MDDSGQKNGHAHVAVKDFALKVDVSGVKICVGLVSVV